MFGIEFLINDLYLQRRSLLVPLFPIHLFLLFIVSILIDRCFYICSQLCIFDSHHHHHRRRAEDAVVYYKLTG